MLAQLPGAAAFHLDPDALLAGMDSRLFEQWRTFYGLDPWTPDRADTQNGLLCAVIKSTQPGCTPGPPAKYMVCPPPDRQEKPQSETQIKQTFDVICEARRRAKNDRQNFDPL